MEIHEYGLYLAVKLLEDVLSTLERIIGCRHVHAALEIDHTDVVLHHISVTLHKVTVVRRPEKTALGIKVRINILLLPDVVA